MRKATVRKGLWTIIAGVVIVTVATFYHSAIADVFNITAETEEKLVSFAFLWGGIIASFGIVVTVLGVVSTAVPGEDVRLLPVVVILVVTIILFFSLLGASFSGRLHQDLRPGESITI